MMPKWLAPWLVTVVLVLAVIVAVTLNSVGLNGATVIGAMLVAIVIGGAIRARLRYLKEHPPNPELTHKPFWRF